MMLVVDKSLISIHPPRAGWDLDIHPPLRVLYDFNPPTPCGVGLDIDIDIQSFKKISIHPPRAGWDKHIKSLVLMYHKFQSTHPVRGGT